MLNSAPSKDLRRRNDAIFEKCASVNTKNGIFLKMQPAAALTGQGFILATGLLFNHKPGLVSDWLEKPIDECRLVCSLHRAINGLQCNACPRGMHVEDDPDIQQITAEIAHDVADFACAATLAEAVLLLQTRRFDLVLLDLTLGRDSGWSLFETIYALNPSPPVIVFSASEVEPENSRQVHALLVKANTSKAELLHTIERVLQQSR